MLNVLGLANLGESGVVDGRNLEIGKHVSLEAREPHLGFLTPPVLGGFDRLFEPAFFLRSSGPVGGCSSRYGEGLVDKTRYLR